MVGNGEQKARLTGKEKLKAVLQGIHSIGDGMASIAEGMATFDISGRSQRRSPRRSHFQTDQEAMGADWNAVGNELKKAMTNIDSVSKNDTETPHVIRKRGTIFRRKA